MAKKFKVLTQAEREAGYVAKGMMRVNLWLDGKLYMAAYLAVAQNMNKPPKIRHLLELGLQRLAEQGAQVENRPACAALGDGRPNKKG